MVQYLWNWQRQIEIHTYGPISDTSVSNGQIQIPDSRRGAPNTIILLIIRQSYWRTDAPCFNSNGGPNKKKKLLAHFVWSALPLLADRTQKMYRNVRILSRQGEATNGSTVLAHCSCHIKRIKRGGPNSSVRFAYFQVNRLLT
jgi:hypothetical protein